MTRVMFVCLGNICRSPMAEAIFKHMLCREGLDSQISADSSGTAGYHIGSPPHIGTQKILMEHGISYKGIISSPLRQGHLNEFDFIIAMDEENLEDILRMKRKNTKACIKLLSDFAQGDWVAVPDPWYTGNFQVAYDLISAGCEGLLEYIRHI